MNEALTAICILASAIVLIRILARRARRRALMTKYGDAAIVERIMRRTVWEGMTVEQLTDSLGRPVAVDEKLTRRSTTRVYKYQRTGRGRYATRITVRDERVIGWDIK